MIYNPKKAVGRQWVTRNDKALTLGDEAVQQNGIDLTINGVAEIMGEATIRKDGKSLPTYRKINATRQLEGNGIYCLEANKAYLLQIVETIDVPKDVVGLMWMRSTFNRCGCPLFACVFDSGYKGKPTVAIYPTVNINVEKGARVAQILFFEASCAKLYDGQYQFQNLPEGEQSGKNRK